MSNDINDASIYDDNYTILSKIRKIMRQIKNLITRVTNLENAGGYVLPIASSSRLGGIKVGNNLTIREDGTLDAQAGGGGGGDVSGKLDTLYGQLYDPETGEFDRASLNDVEWNKDLVQAPDSGGSGTGDRKMQIPSMWALNQVYAEALNKGGGGGSTLQGNLAKIQGLITLSASGGSFPAVPASMSGAGHSYPFVDVYSIEAVMADTFTANLTNISDHSDIISLEIPRSINFINFDGGTIRLYESGDVIDGQYVGYVSNASKSPSLIYTGNITITFKSNSKSWIATGTGTINYSWDTTQGYRQVGFANLSLKSFTNLTDSKNYSPTSQGEISYYGQANQGGIDKLNWYGYYVH